jgi:outer membrane protein OmpA-like peptidoglycan-associated protein
MRTTSSFGMRTYALALIGTLVVVTGCALTGPYTTKRDKTAKGAAIGAAAGAVAGAVAGPGEGDEILAGAIAGAAIGAGAGAYMDHQEEKLARIPNTSVERLDDGTLLVNFDSDILFEVGSAALSSSSASTLEDVAAVLTEFPKTTIVVQGHTDSTGSDQFNQSLSERRSVAVRNYLVSRGVDPSRLTAIGFGETRPVSDNESPEGRRANRRVDLVLRAKAT